MGIVTLSSKVTILQPHKSSTAKNAFSKFTIGFVRSILGNENSWMPNSDGPEDITTKRPTELLELLLITMLYLNLSSMFHNSL